MATDITAPRKVFVIFLATFSVIKRSVMADRRLLRALQCISQFSNVVAASPSRRVDIFVRLQKISTAALPLCSKNMWGHVPDTS